jgi:hypothetical protein
MGTRDASAMREQATVIRKGTELPADISAALDGGDAEAVYLVHVEKMAPEDAALFLETRAKVQAGIDAAERGEVDDGKAVFARIRAKYGFSV